MNESIASLTNSFPPDPSNRDSRPNDFLHSVLKKISLPENSRVLHVNCGGGGATRLLAQHLNGKGQIIAIDADSKAIRAARANNDDGQNSRIEFRTVTSNSLPFGELEFDLVLSDHALMHCDDPQQLLAEIARVLKQEGQCVTIELDFKGYFLASENHSTDETPRLLNPYIARSLIALCREAGLEPTDLLPNFLVSREPLTRELLLQNNSGVRTLRPRLRHLERFEFNDYLKHTERAVHTQTGGSLPTLFEVALLARKV